MFIETQITTQQLRQNAIVGASVDAMRLMDTIKIPSHLTRLREFLPPIKHYLDDLSTKARRTPKTVLNYAYDLNDFTTGYLAGARNLDIPPDSVDEQLGEEYWHWLNGKGLSVATQARRLTVLRRFYKWMSKRRLVPKDVMANLECPKVPEGEPKPFHYDELDRLFMQPQINTFTGIRDLLAMEILYGSGARLDELLRLRFKDFILAGLEGRPFLSLFGKGRKTRLVPLTRQAVKAFHRYVQVRGLGSPEAPVFMSKWGTRMQDRTFQHRMEVMGKAANVNYPSCHRFRHSFATHMLVNGCPLEVLSQLMGHESLDVTRLYCKLLPIEAFRAYGNAAIREKIRVRRDLDEPAVFIEGLGEPATM
ncbi:MAG TPA: tyrosine-type recombinase/integrase [bacterium]|jgi:site-specific recombinase XerD|nr:tyrosine-type recombinase/integrase [bacterium]